MAAVLVRLRLAILRRRSGGLQALLWTLGVMGGMLGALAVIVTVGAGGEAPAVGSLFTTVLAGWVLIPFLSPALRDQTVDPALLEVYPLTTRDKLVGLLCGGLVAPTSLGTFLMALGLAAAPDLSIGARVVAVAVAVVFTVMCVAWSRAFASATARASSSRRGRDITIVASGLISLVLYGGTQLWAANPESIELTGVAAAGGVLAWTPPGALATVVFATSEAAPMTAALAAALALAGVGAAVGVWAWALSRRERGSSFGVVGARGPRRSTSDLALIPAWWRPLRASAAAGAAAQQARYLFFRNPRASQQVVISFVVAAVLGHATGMEVGLALAAALCGNFAAFTMANGLLNYDGRGVESLVILGAPMRSVLWGKLLIVAGAALLAMTVFTVVEAAFTQGWSLVPASVIFGVAAVAWSSTIGLLVSAKVPFDADTRGSGAMAAVGATFAALAVNFAGVGLVAAIVMITGAPLLPSAVIALLLACGGVATSLGPASRMLERDQVRVAQAFTA